MRWLKRVLLALALLTAIAAALPLFIPLDHYIPRIEQEASTRLKEPVSIKSLGFAVLPLPRVTVGGITVGKTDDIRLGKVTLSLDLFTLLQSTRVIRNIEVDSLILSDKGIDTLAALAKSESAKPSQQPPQLRVAAIELANVVIRFRQGNFGPLDVRLRLGASGAPDDASIRTRDGKLEAHVKPDGSNFLIDAKAKAWTLPVGPAVVFDELTIKGVATPHDVNLDQLRAGLYGGTATGKISLNWQKGMRFDGQLDINELELKQVAAMLSPGTHVSGRLSAKPSFSAAAGTADHLMDALRLKSPFSIRNGVVHGVDIQKAATSLIKQGSTGGETRFEQLSGHLFVEQGNHHFTELKIASGSLAADGKVSVSAKKELSGRINAQIKAVGTSASVPLNVGGTVAAPLLYPTGAAVAGAAVGTVILGPGLGTSVGAKVGNWAEGLFEKKK